MTAAPTAFPVVENGYSPQVVDQFIAKLAERARAQIAGLERRVAELESASPAATGVGDEAAVRIAGLERDLDNERRRPEALERRLVDRDAELAEERARAAVLERRVAELTAEVETLNTVEVADVVEFDAIEIDEVAEPQPASDPVPVAWAQAVIERPLYEQWSQEQRERAAQALRNKRLSACTPTK